MQSVEFAFEGRFGDRDCITARLLYGFEDESPLDRRSNLDAIGDIVVFLYSSFVAERRAIGA